MSAETTPLADALEAALALEVTIDGLLESSGGVDPTLVSVVDWAWYRFSTLRVLLRDEVASATTASLARGLVEEAAYWDWRSATGADRYWLSGKAIREFEQLKERADALDDAVWIDWLIPPDSTFAGSGENQPPPNAADVVNRMGHGFPNHWYDAFPLSIASAVYSLLSTVSHGNLAAVGAVRDSWSNDPQLPALTLHVAGAACAMIALAVLEPNRAIEEAVLAAAAELGQTAQAVHGLRGTPSPATGRTARTTSRASFTVESSIERMPPAPASVLITCERYVIVAAQLIRSHADAIDDGDAISQQAHWCLSFVAQQLDSFTAITRDQMGRALLPYVARPTMELAAAWSWVTRGIACGEFQSRLRTFLGAAASSVQETERAFARRQVTVPARELLGGAHIVDVAAAAGASPERLPPEYLHDGFHGWGGEAWAAPIYGVLSQFVHVTPIALLHLQPAKWHSLSAPAFSVAADAVATSLTLLLQQTLPMAGVAGIDFTELERATNDVRWEASKYHFIG